MIVDTSYANGSVRDGFLNALDAADSRALLALARVLQNCLNPFPGHACDQLSLPKGSTYGCAARTVLGRSAPVQ